MCLKELYNAKKANCCRCGCTLESWGGEPLGSIFVLDDEGNYYCINCDHHFEDVDERIYEED